MMHRHDKTDFRRKQLALASFVLVSAFALLYGPVRGALVQTLYVTAPGMWTFGAKVDEVWNGFWGEMRIKRSLVYENEVLKADVSRMQAQVLDRNLLEEKVMRLEEALGRVHKDDRVSGQVLAGAGRAPYDTLIIDVGTEHGINVGDVVVYAGAGVIGSIEEVYDTSAKVKLYSTPGEERSVIVGPHTIPGTARGRGMGNYEVKVPQGSAVFVGDEVRLPGGSLVLGFVGSTESKPADPVIRVLFRSPFNIAEIASVEVITQKK